MTMPILRREKKLVLSPSDLIRDLEDLQRILSERQGWNVQQCQSLLKDLEGFLPDLITALKQYRTLN